MSAGGGSVRLPPLRAEAPGGPVAARAMAQLLAIGTDWHVKFRLPLLRKGYCEAVATVSEVEERPEGVKVRATFSEIDDETRNWIKQYAADMSYLKDELRKATDA